MHAGTFPVCGVGRTAAAPSGARAGRRGAVPGVPFILTPWERQPACPLRLLSPCAGRLKCLYFSTSARCRCQTLSQVRRPKKLTCLPSSQTQSHRALAFSPATRCISAGSLGEGSVSETVTEAPAATWLFPSPVPVPAFALAFLMPRPCRPEVGAA